MAYIYFDESIRNHGDFIIGALVISDTDLSHPVRQAWTELGLDPDTHEYKSSTPKAANPDARNHRDIVHSFLASSRLALLVSPVSDRAHLGDHCVVLLSQLHTNTHLGPGPHTLYLDQGIRLSTSAKDTLAGLGITAHCHCDSRGIAGIQVADHAAHTLGSMLLEQLGLISKSSMFGDEYGYVPAVPIELGYELWATIRYSFIGVMAGDHSTPDTDDPAPADRITLGHGLYIAPSCSQDLADHARRCFATIYLGCIH